MTTAIITTRFGNRSTATERFEACIAATGVNLTVATAGPGAALLWHKERLINRAVKALPPSVTKVVVMDTDVVFSNPEWLNITEEALEKHPLVQPYSQALWEPDPETNRGERLPAYGFAYGTGQYPTMFKRATWKMVYRFYPAFAWAVRRDFFEDVGFPDKLVTGGADNVVALGAIGMLPNCPDIPITSEPLRKYVLDYGKKLATYTGGKLGYVSGRVTHLYHGSLKGRHYAERWPALNDFNPDDLTLDDNGLYRWKNPNNPTRTSVETYLHSRNS